MPRKNPFEGLPVYLQPKLRLFLSADLVGSTAFKQGPGYPLEIDTDRRITPLGPHWLEPITSFYSDFSAEFAEQWRLFQEMAAEAPRWPTGTAPEFWKGIGDELVFVKDVRDPKEVAGSVWAWMLALQKYRTKLREKQPSLDIKSTAWIAGFPINNSEVVFDLGLPDRDIATDDARLSHFQKLEDFYDPKADRTKFVRDFIGTSVDTGFRLATKSTPRRMTASIEVVLMITSTPPPDQKFGPIRIFFDGFEQLKGVLGGKPYPVFWIDMFQTDSERALIDLEDRLRGRIHGAEEDLRSFCEEFIKANSKYLIRPFIFDCPDDSFKKLPPKYPEKLAEWHGKIKAERQRYASETKFDEPPPASRSSKTPRSAAEIESMINDWLAGSRTGPEHLVSSHIRKSVSRQKKKRR